ncbi:MAG: hypothetical protein K8S98_16620 [Planctomycetes bacterium]|nr:hypothetical protein [Planctomycetota bacterium]
MLSEDSVVGSYKSPSLQVDFDFGWYSDDSFAGRYDGKVMRSGSLEATTVDGRPAQLAAWNDNAFPPEFPNVVALYVPDVDHAGEAVGEVKLSFTVAYRDPADVEIARRIVDSVSIAPSAR